MRNFLKVMLVVIIIAVMCLLGYTAKYYFDEKEQVNTLSSNEKQNVSSSNETKTNEDNDKEESDDNTIVEEENQEETGEQPVNEETSISDEEKAIELAKKEYGSSDGVYFRIEQIESNGVYIVSVRDNETTKDLVWYTVDVNNGTVR